MFDLHFNFQSILPGIIFGVIGLSSLNYGRKLTLWQPAGIGLALIIYPYFCGNAWLSWGIGAGLCVLLWFYHDE